MHCTLCERVAQNLVYCAFVLKSSLCWNICVSTRRILHGNTTQFCVAVTQKFQHLSSQEWFWTQECTRVENLTILITLSPTTVSGEFDNSISLSNVFKMNESNLIWKWIPLSSLPTPTSPGIWNMTKSCGDASTRTRNPSKIKRVSTDFLKLIKSINWDKISKYN
jgi:hypothetical protein